MVLNERKRKIARFETVRPLHFIEFCGTEPVLFGSAENGLLCCHNLAGAQLWQERVWSNVGAMSVTGAGDIIYLANFSHGVQAFDGDGVSLGAYVLEGTVDKVSASYEPYRLIATTIEQYVYWLDSDGDLIWASSAPAGVVDLKCDPPRRMGRAGIPVRRPAPPRMGRVRLSPFAPRKSALPPSEHSRAGSPLPPGEPGRGLGVRVPQRSQ